MIEYKKREFLQFILVGVIFISFALVTLAQDHTLKGRKFQGIPSLAISPEGRLWATWYAGITPSEDQNNYVVIATSGDNGQTWTENLIIDPDNKGPVRAFDPELWMDPEGRLWSVWAQTVGHDGSIAGLWARINDDPDRGDSNWSQPRRITDGIMMCKPTVLSSGEWIIPASTWRDTDNSARVVISTDKGQTFSLRGACNIPEEVRNFDEHMIVERQDKSLWMLVRTTYGIGESISMDRGQTWSRLVPSSIQHATARFFVRRLQSGNLLLVKHGPIGKRTGRSHLTAYVSEDDGRTWSGGLLLDERSGVSYPDGQQSPDGTIHIIYDYSRTGAREILMATFTEEDVNSGNQGSSTVSLRMVVSKFPEIEDPKRVDNSLSPEKRLWKPVPDKIYLQELGQKIPLDMPVTSIAIFNNQCYVVVEGSIHMLSGETVHPVRSAPANVTRINSLNRALWALSSDGIYRLEKHKWQKIDDKDFVDVCMHLGVLHAATRDEVYRLEDNKFIDIKPESGYLSSDITMLMEDGSQVLADPVQIGPIDRIASYSGTLYLLGPGGRVALFDGKIVNQDFVDWGTLPSPNTTDMLSVGSRLFISTYRGLGVLRGASLTSLKGKDGLPFEETTCLEAGFENDIWIGTSKGAIRMMKDDWHYFGADHWLPGDNVNDIAVGNNVVYIATDHGIGVIRYEPYTLRKKADYYERHIDQWGHKRLGFIHTIYKKGDQWVREISDNDGGHTAPYLASMSYKYAVTGDLSARHEAVESFKAMLWLEEVTTVDGFVARSIWSTTADADSRGRHGSGGLPAKWYPTKDGKWYWKGDTSSDEIIAHFYAVSLFHDLVAEGVEKEMAKKHLAKIASFIKNNGFMLIDMDGKPTRWGRWDAKYLLSPYGYSDKGLNGLEAMTFMQTAFVLTGDKEFEEGFQQLSDWGYQNYIVRLKNTFPPTNVAPWDDNLAFRSYYTVLRYTKDPVLRSMYLRSLERTFEVKRMEHIAWFNFAYGALTGNDCEAEEGVAHLREWTLDCVEHNYRNSFRDDLIPEPGYVPYEAGTKAMSPRETSVKRGSRNALGYDGGAGGGRVMEPTGFLRDYWMGRYHGIIKVPTTSEKDLISVNREDPQELGARPYDGPGRPKMY